MELKTVIYCRSAIERQENNTIELQKQRMYSAIENNENGYKYHIVDEIVEIGSGLSLDREGINKLIQMAMDKKIDCVLVADPSRLSRITKRYFELLDKLWQYGVRICYLDDTNEIIDFGLILSELKKKSS